MKKFILSVIMGLALMVAPSFCQTTESIKPTSCVLITHCLMFANDSFNSGEGSLVWTEGTNFLMFNSYPSQGSGLYATNVTVYSKYEAPGTDRSKQYPFTLHVVATDDADTFTLTLNLSGYKFYHASGGGRAGGGAGWRYAITAGNITIQ